MQRETLNLSLPLYTCWPVLSGIRAEDKHTRKQRKKDRNCEFSWWSGKTM